MRFKGNVIENLQAASESRDNILFNEIIIDYIANLIEDKPDELVKILRYSNIELKNDVSKHDLINIASYNLHNNTIFHKNIAVNLAKGSSATKEDYASAEGELSESTDGGNAGSIVSSIANMIGSISSWGASSKDLKSEEIKSKNLLYEKIFGEEKKTNWTPIVLIGGILIIGAIVVWRLTAKK